MPGATGTMMSFAETASANATPCNGPAPPKGTSENSLGVDAARHGVGADCQRHVGIDDLNDAECCIRDREPHRLADLGFDGPFRELRINGQVAAQQFVGIEPAQRDLRVRDGWLGAAVAVTRGPGVGTCGTGSNVKSAGRVDEGNGSAACPDRHEIDHGN